MKAPIAFLLTLYGASCFASLHSEYNLQYETHRVATQKAALYLSTEVCSDPVTHSQLEEFNKCFESRVVLSRSPTEFALNKMLQQLPTIAISNIPGLAMAKFIAIFILLSIAGTLFAKRNAMKQKKW